MSDLAATAVRPVRPVRPARSAMTVAAAVAVAHGVNDAYAAFLPPLLPRLMGKLGISIALAAGLAMIFSLASSVVQPLVGWAADRWGRRIFVVAGPLLSAVFLSLMGLAPTFGLLVVLLILGGLGSAAFHPPGASFAARVGEGRGSGMRLSVFSVGGALGYAAGPLIAVALVAAVGLEGMWVAMVPGILVAVALFFILPTNRSDRPTRPPPSPTAVLRLLAGPLGILFGVSALGAFVQRVFLTLAPIIAAEAGRSEAAGAAALSVYLGAQAFGTLAGGVLTDRTDRRRLLVVLTTLSVPAHMAALGLAPGTPWALAAAASAGFLNMALLPPLVVMAQEIIPDGAAVGSAIVMGLAWAAGSIGVLGTGVLADRIGPADAALFSVPLLFVAVLLSLHPALGAHARGPHDAGGGHLPRSGNRRG